MSASRTEADIDHERAGRGAARPGTDADHAHPLHTPATAVPHEPPESSGDGWTIADAEALYRTESWGDGYFGINERGHVFARVAGAEIDLRDVMEGLRVRSINPPVLLRFTDILSDRLRRLADAFTRAMEENHYRGRYRAVYPIKVNQQHHIVEELSAFGKTHGFGLEVGSKPELLAVMAMTGGKTEQPIICNGFKDARYIEAVILATKLGRTIIPVVENLNELRLIIDYSKRYDVRPRIGVRVKLEAQGSGRWMESAGSRSKFGLFVSEVLDMVAELRSHDMLGCLELLHCHNGSQVQDIRRIKNAVTELAHIYVELVRMGAGMKIIDIGGGVGVDYRGDQANAPGSMNYTLDEYASDVVYRIGSVCDAKGVEHPTIVTECGRAMVAYSSVLVFNVLGRTGPGMFREAPDLKGVAADPRTLPQPIQDLRTAFESVTVERLAECYHDAQQARDAARSLFTLGYLSLEMRALAERLFWATCARVRAVRQTLDEDWEELDELDQILSDVYFCNFSLFQSLPDSWAIDQVFPIMPIHRLDERPTRKAVLADVTCDSDGQIDFFIDEGGTKRVLDVHRLAPGEEYYIGTFLVGAYQETLGDLHNLFGDTHAVHISVEDGQWGIDEVVTGDTAREVLGYVQYDADGFARQLRRECERAVREGRLTAHETRTLVQYYESGLSGYTYLEPREDPNR